MVVGGVESTTLRALPTSWLAARIAVFASIHFGASGGASGGITSCSTSRSYADSQPRRAARCRSIAAKIGSGSPLAPAVGPQFGVLLTDGLAVSLAVSEIWDVIG